MFFEVRAKCGHVGRNKYLLKDFYVQSESAKDAALIVRYTPRVKHHQKDAIIYVKQITREEYIAGKIKHKNDQYFHIHNSSEQKRLLLYGITEEKKLAIKKKSRSNYQYKKWKILEFEFKKILLGGYYG